MAKILTYTQINYINFHKTHISAMLYYTMFSYYTVAVYFLCDGCVRV